MLHEYTNLGVLMMLTLFFLSKDILTFVMFHAILCNYSNSKAHLLYEAYTIDGQCPPIMKGTLGHMLEYLNNKSRLNLIAI